MVAELEWRASSHVLAGTRADFEVHLYRDGTLTSPGNPTSVTVAIVDDDGVAIASGTATSGGTGILQFTATAAALANAGRVTVTWGNIDFGAEPVVSVVTEHEVVGDHLFTEYDARNVPGPSSSSGKPLSNATTYPDLDIRRARDRIHDEFEGLLNYPLGRRYRQFEFIGDGRSRALCPVGYLRSVRAVSYRSAGAWVAFTAAERADVYGDGRFLEREQLGVWGAKTRYRVSVEAGRDIPESLRRAGLLLILDQLPGRSTDQRTLSYTTQTGQTFRMAAAGERGRHYGLPEVDELIERERHVVVA
jgi:hypothetical protein